MGDKRIINERETIMPENLNCGMGMKYYNFLKVVLVVGAILNLGSAITYFNGEVYLKEGLKAAVIYSKFPNMKLLDIAYGMVIMALAAFQFYVRNQLVWKTKRAPNLIVTFHTVSFVPNMIYNIVAGVILENVTVAVFSSVIPVLIASPIHAYITYVYFKKRKFLFVN